MPISVASMLFPGDGAGKSGDRNLAEPHVNRKGRSARRKLGRAFYKQDAAELARQLLGTIMVRRADNTLLRARIVETEAYLGPKDLASHSSKGRTKRTEVMFGPAGRAYVYFIYGMYTMFNIVAGETGDAHAVLVRGAEPLDGWEADLTGPGKLARAFGITLADNRLDLTADDIYFVADPSYRPRILKTKRVGIDYARHWKTRLLRFIDVSNPVAARLRY
jgi:DNA-3-methyladenine glycosylase